MSDSMASHCMRTCMHSLQLRRSHRHAIVLFVTTSRRARKLLKVAALPQRAAARHFKKHCMRTSDAHDAHAAQVRLEARARELARELVRVVALPWCDIMSVSPRGCPLKTVLDYLAVIVERTESAR